MKNYYETLSITRSASVDDIKKAYRNFAMKWHPDVNMEEGAHEIFIEINEAYEILRDNAKRELYDLLLDEYLNNKSLVIKPKISEEDYIRYNNWYQEAHETANNRARMPFAEFAKVIGQAYNAASNGCGFIVAIIMWFMWGPYAVFYLGQGIIKMINDFPVYGFKTRYIFMVLFFLIGIIITALGIITFFRYINKEQD